MKTVTIYTTSKCNIHCKHCGVGLDQRKPRKQQSTDELKKILSELSKGGAKFVTILGGEATIYRSDLAIILDYATEIGIKVSINTNLTSWDVIEPLLDKPALNSIIVSLDGATSETHNANRGKDTFEKTIVNLAKLSRYYRIVEGTLLLEIAFVITKLNYHETSNMIQIAKDYRATHLNVKNVKMFGRASMFSNVLGFGKLELLDTYTSLILNWMLSEKTFELDVFIPPAFAEYLNNRFDLNLSTAFHPACGGTNVFSYVDLLGNHLPCPAMSFEENPNTGRKARSPLINLIDNDISSSFNSPLFMDFEKNRNNRIYTNSLHPCMYCKFNKQCQPCVANITGGANKETIDICSAIFEHGNATVPNIKKDIWIYSGNKEN